MDTETALNLLGNTTACFAIATAVCLSVAFTAFTPLSLVAILLTNFIAQIVALTHYGIGSEGTNYGDVAGFPALVAGVGVLFPQATIPASLIGAAACAAGTAYHYDSDIDEDPTPSSDIERLKQEYQSEDGDIDDIDEYEARLDEFLDEETESEPRHTEFAEVDSDDRLTQYLNQEGEADLETDSH